MVSKQTITQISSGKFETKMLAGKYYQSIRIDVEDGRLLFHFPYNKELIDEIKTSFEGRKYHGYIDNDGRKIWSAPITYRNIFQLEALQGKYAPNPYARWSKFEDLTDIVLQYCQNRHVPITPYRHQLEMVSEALQAKWYLMAAEMGTGKTLASILTIEQCPFQEYGQIIWVGPRSALIAAKAEFRKWKPKFMPQYYTYDGLRKLVEEWNPGDAAPRVLVLDESSKCKTPTSKRSVAAKHIADSMRQDHGEDCYILELSGTPAPKTPSDWWFQCEIACPGFIREGNWYSFRERLGHVESRESVPGAGAYKHLKSWKDDDKKCKHCAEEITHPNHDTSFLASLNQEQTHETHEFVPGDNEVAIFAERAKGLVGVWLKKDCLDLPEKRYEEIELEADPATLNAARMVLKTSNRAADALIRLRTLSDGFLYTETPTGTFKPCKGCDGTGKVTAYYEEDNPYDMLLPEEIEGRFRYIYDECPPDEDPVAYVPTVIGKRQARFESRQDDCYTCSGKGEIEQKERTINEVPCPKIDLLENLLEEHEEIGRLNVYAGFQGSILRCVRTAQKKGWHVIKADGQGWAMTEPTGQAIQIASEDMVYAYQEQQDDYPRVCFVGQPGAAGMGLTLTASPTTFYYSNDFNPESRLQSEDRGHRIGMDVVRGGRIIDCIHLPSDRKVIDSLKKSKQLQLLSMKGLEALYQGAT